MFGETYIGEVFKYEAQSGMAYFELAENLALGQTLHLKGLKNDFIQTLEEMHVAYQDVEVAYRGDWVGIKVDLELQEHDKVFIQE